MPIEVPVSQFDNWICWSLFLDERGEFLSEHHIFFRLSDPKIELISAILQLWSLESLWPLKLSSSPCIRTIDTRYLPGRFVTSFVDCNHFIIALVMEIGIFNALALFLQPRSNLRSSTILFCTSELYYILMFYSLWWMIKGIWPLCSSYL